jgi:hypothetical protein
VGFFGLQELRPLRAQADGALLLVEQGNSQAHTEVRVSRGGPHWLHQGIFICTGWAGLGLV